MISRSLKSRTRKGRTASRRSGPPRLRRRIPVFRARPLRVSDRAREDRLLALAPLQVGVELHADVPDEEAAAGRDLDRIGPADDESRGHGTLVEPLQGIGEVRGEVDPVRSLNRADIEIEIAHEA